MKLAVTFLLALFLMLNEILAQEKISALYAGGPIYYGRDYAIEELKNSGFNTLIIWTIHIDKDGNLNFNGEFPLCADGEFIGDRTYPLFRKDIKKLKSLNSTITRIEFGLSAWRSGTYDHIKDLYEAEGVGPESILYRNFKALIEAIPEIDAFNNDDEGTYDVASSVAFHTMLYQLGVKTAGVPYTRASGYWKPFTDQMNQANPGSVDLMYLQVYAGGAGNNPCSDSWQTLGVPVIPGVWAEGSSQGNKNAGEIEADMTNWNNSCSIGGGFLWLYDDFDNSSLVNQYANAINKVFDIKERAPVSPIDRTPQDQTTDISIDEDLSWEVGGFNVTNTLYFGETPNLDSQHIVTPDESTFYDPGVLSNSTTYYWKIVQTNRGGQNESQVWSFTTEVETVVPQKVVIKSPLHKVNNVSTSHELNWEPAEDAFIYDIFFGANQDISQVDSTRDLKIKVEDLKPNTRYYWRVDSRNRAGVRSGDISYFDTKGINLADQAELTPSTEQGDSKWKAKSLIDNKFEQIDFSGEWRSREQDPSIKFTWSHKQKLGSIVIFDNVEPSVNTLSGTFTFSDESSIKVEDIPRDGSPKEITFSEKTVDWVMFQIDDSEGENNGLAEMQIYEFSDAERLPLQSRGHIVENVKRETSFRSTFRWKRGSFSESHILRISEDSIFDDSDFSLKTTGKFYVWSDSKEDETYYWRVDEVNKEGVTPGDKLSFKAEEGVLSFDSIPKEQVTHADGENLLAPVIFPNPITHEIRLRWSENSQHIRLHVFNIHGRLAHILSVNQASVDGNTMVWDMSGTNKLSKGVYMLIVESDGKQFRRKLLVE